MRKIILPTLSVAALATAMLAAGCLTRPPATATVTAWPHEKSDIAPDAKIIWGKLDNGFRYVIMPNQEPPGRLSLRLYVASGSLNETEAQRGIAHFLEHMAFNGSKRYPDGNAMLKNFQNLGLDFGTDVNAHTAFDETVYKLDLPKNTPEYIGEALSLFQDDANGLLLKTEDIDKERGIILSEKRDREDARYRSMVAGLRFSLPGLTLADRFPIGNAEVISKAPAQAFRDYYHKYYAANRMILAVAGDVKPDEVKAMIQAKFGDLHRSECPNRNLGKLVVPAGLRTACYSEPEIQSTHVTFSVARPADTSPDTAARRINDIQRQAVTAIVNRRFEKLARAPGARFAGAGIDDSSVYNLAEMSMASATCKDNDWQGAVDIMEQEIRRACEFGFTTSEIEMVKAEVLNGYKQAVSTAASRKSRGLVDGLYNSVADNKVFSSPETNLNIAKTALAGFTPKLALQEMRAMWGTADIAVMVTGKQPVEGGEAAIRAIYEKSHAVAVTAPAVEAALTFAYQDFGPAGQIVKDEQINDLGIRQINFANQVRLNIKKTDFEKGRIHISARIGAGAASMPRDKQGLRNLASGLFTAGGLKAHKSEDMEAIFAGKTVGAGFSVDEDSFVLAGGTNAEDLRDELNLLCAYLTAPGYRADALRQYQATLEGAYQKLRQDPMSFYKNTISTWIVGNDPRFGMPAEAKMRAYTMQDIESWLAPQLRDGYLEISIVGDVDPEAAIKAVAATFGALPPRQAAKAIAPETMKLSHPWNETAKTFTYPSKEPRAITIVYWPVQEKYDAKLARRISLLGEILSDRLRVKIREEAGAAYSPGARGTLSRDYAGMGYVMGLAQVEPKMVEKVGGMIADIGADLAKTGVTAEEFTRAKNPTVFQMREQLRSNGYWLGGVLASCQEDPRPLDWCRDLAKDTEAVSLEELNAIAGKYLGTGKPLRVQLLPETAK
jgi:zinc protease